MDQSIEKELNQLNYEFYEKIGKYWNNQPNYEWDGWGRLIEPIKNLQSKLGRNLRVLDLGCGNGRFLHWLVKNFAEVEYVGVDFSDYLLGVAKKNDQKRIGTFIKSDLFMDEWIFLNSLVDFDLIVSFGLVHHIPSKELVETFFGNLNKLIRNQKTLGIFTIGTIIS
ncbi:methyltransferase domain-containing protein [Candidatus Gracilibacteria bacterium]|nr:methyltransferase domain-containing protein [Candidatus Gracilibacteria bacterium]